MSFVQDKQPCPKTIFPGKHTRFLHLQREPSQAGFAVARSWCPVEFKRLSSINVLFATMYMMKRGV